MADDVAQTNSDKEEEHWMNSKWRPAMGWMYMVVCITDFILYPVLWAIFQAYNHISPVKPWDPLTLQGAGLFHIAMGAVLGVTAWSRGQEKIAGVNNGGITPAGGNNSPFTTSEFNSGRYGGIPNSTTQATSFSSSPGFGTTSQTPIMTTSTGKKIIPVDNEPVI